jgi:enolase
MILPVGASSFREAMQMGSEVYHHLKACLCSFGITNILFLCLFYK